MVWEGIFPDFNIVDSREHVNIIGYPNRKKYRECELYEWYMKRVLSNLFMMDIDTFRLFWFQTPLTLRFLVAAENQTTIKW
jgi:hypothetical protein